MTSDHASSITKLNIGRIPPLSTTMLELLQQLNSGEAAAADLENIIRKDANTAATILKIANSPFYGLNKKIQSVRDACVLLGFNNLRNIVYATAMETFLDNTSLLSIKESLRQHTLATAIIAVQLGRLIRFEESTGYTLGLLHELGKQITLTAAPERFLQYIEKAKYDREGALDDIASMCTIGEMVAKSWHLPDSFISCIRFYHNPEKSSPTHRIPILLIHSSHLLANRAGHISPGEDSLPASDDQLMQTLHQLGITLELDDIDALVKPALNEHLH